MAVSSNTYTLPQSAYTVNVDPNRSLGTLAVVPTLNEEDIRKGAFELPVSTMVDLWLARFGNDWVDLSEIENSDAFFYTMFTRLKQLSELEVHYLTDRARYVCRLPQ